MWLLSSSRFKGLARLRFGTIFGSVEALRLGLWRCDRKGQGRMRASSITTAHDRVPDLGKLIPKLLIFKA